MKPETPILMITLAVPVLPETSAEEVLDAIRDQLGDALREIQENAGEERHIDVEEDDAEAITAETEEPFSEETRADLLASLGYSSAE